MLLSIFVIVAVALIAYLWSAQGLFSAFLHFACVVAAGAIAFAVWEPLVYGVLMGVGALRDYAWGIGLIVPFLVSLVVLRLAMDKLIPANLDMDDTTNFVGGLAFGALSGVLTAGIVLVSIGFFRIPSDFMGYKPVEYDANGNIVRGSSLLLPADRLTIGFYETLSSGALATSRPLAKLAPSLHEQATLVRFTVGDRGRTTIAPDDFSVLGRFQVESNDVRDLLADTFAPRAPDGSPVPQIARTMQGESVPAGSRIEGFVIRFESGARETNGQFVASPGHFRLVGVRDDGEAVAMHPIAAISQGEAWALDIYRWRFDASEVFISSVGGGSTTTMGFEFVVPPGVRPTHLIVRNVRVPVAGEPEFVFTSSAERDSAIRDRSLFESLGVTLTAREGGPPDRAAAATPQREPIRRINRLPGPVNRSVLRGSIRFNEQNEIIDGEHRIPNSAFNEIGIARDLMVEAFADGPDTYIVQVDVSIPSRVTLFGRAVDAAERLLPPLLVDNLGQRYEAIGFIHRTNNDTAIRFTPGSPIRAMENLPQLSNSRPNERLTLIFRVSAQVTIEQFTLGQQVIEDGIGMTIPPPRRQPR
ncbi:MAG: CvpA family protein [Phycisphaerales bacterium]|nr:MAG: CvpA family protein [Phycisphaerales bacterium]